MSYIVIPVYSFECDHPGCTQTYDSTPGNHGNHRLLDAANAELRTQGWAAKDGKHYCPQHRQAGE